MTDVNHYKIDKNREVELNQNTRLQFSYAQVDGESILISVKLNFHTTFNLPFSILINTRIDRRFICKDLRVIYFVLEVKAWDSYWPNPTIMAWRRNPLPSTVT